ncbi:uncharacterized protein L201_001372 [Kwoniella dendrophila CBS 6074]|uniref:Uncharacterized protein n=1 Tax=Kwoniella dendrophila CBS 6074 TaxID=1295534 RepID=A0AAX4JPM3_9TREE
MSSNSPRRPSATQPNPFSDAYRLDSLTPEGRNDTATNEGSTDLERNAQTDSIRNDTRWSSRRPSNSTMVIGGALVGCVGLGVLAIVNGKELGDTRGALVASERQRIQAENRNSELQAELDRLRSSQGTSRGEDFSQFTDASEETASTQGGTVVSITTSDIDPSASSGDKFKGV